MSASDAKALRLVHHSSPRGWWDDHAANDGEEAMRNLLRTTGWRLSEATICLRNLNRTCPNGRACTGCLPGGPTFDHMHLWLRPNSRRKVLQIQPYDVEEDLLNDWSAEHSLVWEHRQDINWWGGDTKSIIIYPAEDPSP